MIGVGSGKQMIGDDEMFHRIPRVVHGTYATQSSVGLRGGLRRVLTPCGEFVRLADGGPGQCENAVPATAACVQDGAVTWIE